MTILFWASFVGAFYAYFGYPVVLFVLGKLKNILSPDPHFFFSAENAPSVTIIIPAYNEQDVIGNKIKNTLDLYYPGKLQILIVSDGSTDETENIVESYLSNESIDLLRVKDRKGKANALNKALVQARGDIIVFSDASITLDEQSIWNIIQPFANKKIGCVSGEDIIDGGGGEGLYGRYELYLRNLESKIGSIVGASGSFYAQRRELVTPFLEGLAPDFLSVMNTVESGYRVISYPDAFGFMKAVKSHKDEFQRKVRTLIRGMTALFKKKELMNPIKYPLFSLFLISHKLMRWLVPIFLITMIISSVVLSDQIFFFVILLLQSLFYLLALLAALGIKSISNTIPGKISLYFTSVNIAILFAWLRYFLGSRQEIWSPSKRA